MTSGFDAFSLALFTSLAPAGVVAFIVVAIARLNAPSHDTAVRLDRMVALPFSVALAGFIASATHLGTPANALHVFSGIGRSPLSNEVLSAIAFLFLVGSYWMVAFKENFPNRIAKPWLALSCIAGIGLIGCTSTAYSVSTVPTWDTPFSPVNLVLSALSAGPVLGLLFLEMARARSRAPEIALAVLAGLMLIASTVALVLHDASLANIANNEFDAGSLVPGYQLAIALHVALGATSVLLAGWSLRARQSERLTLILRITASVLMLAAVFVTRVVFYNLHMTLGF